MRRGRKLIWIVSVVALSGVIGWPSHAQDSVTLDLREPIELQTLLDYTAREYGFNLMYEPGVLSGSVRLQTNDAIPREALLGMLQAALRLHGYTMVDLDVPGFKRVARVDDVTSAIPDALPGGGRAGPPPAAGGADELVVRAVRLADIQPSSRCSSDRNTMLALDCSTDDTKSTA
ncbi:MAG: hypothetical protein AAFX76_12625, partial [Planctomycetota bacterium]